MNEKQYEENARKIVELVDGMTDVQWSRVRHLIDVVLEREKAKVTFEKPEHLDLLMEQSFIK